MIGLKTNLSVQRRLDFTLVPTRSWENSPTKLRLNEELRVEFAGSGIEGRSWNGRIYMIGCSDRVGSK